MPHPLFPLSGHHKNDPLSRRRRKQSPESDTFSAICLVSSMIISRFRSIAVHACQKDLPCAKAGLLSSPTRRHPDPHQSVRRSYRYSSRSHPRVSLHQSRPPHTGCRICLPPPRSGSGRVDRGRIDRNLVCALAEQCLKIIHRPDAASDRKRNEHLLRHAPYHIDHGISRASEVAVNVQKYQFVRTCLIVSCRNLHRISGIP